MKLPGVRAFDGKASVGEIGANGRDERADIDKASLLLRRFLPREGESRFRHRQHFIERLKNLLPGFLVFYEFGAKPQGRYRRAQIVSEGGKHLGAVMHEAAQPFLHVVEGPDGVQNFARPPFLELGGGFASPQGRGSVDSFFKGLVRRLMTRMMPIAGIAAMVANWTTKGEAWASAGAVTATFSHDPPFMGRETLA